MRLLIIGSGGREHALGWKLAQSPGCEKVYFAPGNGGGLGDKPFENVAIPVADIQALADFAGANADFTVVGPELPLSLGVCDVFRQRGLRVFGPSKDAARLESSKAYAKAFMKKYNIPTADYECFDNTEAALNALARSTYPLVVKADGLAAGKGVTVCRNEAEARQSIESMMTGRIFGSAGDRIVLEEYLTGRELTLLCFTDGKTILPLDSARDYKRAMDNGEGPNTGGMGSISPAPGYEPGRADFIARRTLEGIQAEGFDYRGLLYIGLMLTADGPKVIEYNARFGDPETEALMPRLDSDLLDIMLAVEERRLEKITLRWKPQTAVCVIMASGGYPGAYATGLPIQLPQAEREKQAVIFHAGTKCAGNMLVTDGGRVLAVTALGADGEAARAAAYALAGQICFKDCYYRKDIGLDMA